MKSYYSAVLAKNDSKILVSLLKYFFQSPLVYFLSGLKEYINDIMIKKTSIFLCNNIATYIKKYSENYELIIFSVHFSHTNEAESKRRLNNAFLRISMVQFEQLISRCV